MTRETGPYDRFRIPGHVSIEPGAGGLPLVRLRNEHAEAAIYIYGAHIAAFKPRDHEEALWLSPYSYFEEGKPIRGGIPICFPWFGPHRSRADLPLHGFVRTRMWEILSAAMLPDGRTSLLLSLKDDEGTRAVWPFRFRLEFSIILGETLEMALLIENRGEEPFACEEGFHTYFRVEDPAQCEVLNLDGLEYIDRVRGDARAFQSGALRLEGETVNAYMHAPAACELVDHRARRVLRVEQRRMDATLVWNPGPIAAAKNPEILDSWNRFVCVESANCLDHSLAIEPGASHLGVAGLSVERL
jgi:glucose-6-phosphate 1-epimerase